MDRDEILRVLRAFESAGLEYVLIGATAMGFHGVVRATEDIAVVIRATAENVERLRKWPPLRSGCALGRTSRRSSVTVRATERSLRECIRAA